MITSASGVLKRVVAARLSPGEDLLAGIESICRSYSINSGVILSGIGSLRAARFFDPVELPGVKAGYGYSKPLEEPGPIELVSSSGCVCSGEGNEPLLHIHCCFSDASGRAFAGHLIEGNLVLLTADLVIGEFGGIEMARRFDEDLGVPLVKPRQL